MFSSQYTIRRYGKADQMDATHIGILQYGSTSNP